MQVTKNSKLTKSHDASGCLVDSPRSHRQRRSARTACQAGRASGTTTRQMNDVLPATGAEVVEDDDVVAPGHQGIGEVGADEAGTSRDQMS